MRTDIIPCFGLAPFYPFSVTVMCCCSIAVHYVILLEHPFGSAPYRRQWALVYTNGSYTYFGFDNIDLLVLFLSDHKGAVHTTRRSYRQGCSALMLPLPSDARRIVPHLGNLSARPTSGVAKLLCSAQ
ncbi:hypothetical protein C8Q78DRAFT_668200 [Trametes maxima]|nr:hypothetical protein C8Q78DRAFT_668200 [Trametes maxima]